MRARWIMGRPGPEENRKAAGLALGVGAALAAVVFYFARMFLARERIESGSEGAARGRSGKGREGEER